MATKMIPMQVTSSTETGTEDHQVLEEQGGGYSTTDDLSVALNIFRRWSLRHHAPVLLTTWALLLVVLSISLAALLASKNSSPETNSVGQLGALAQKNADRLEDHVRWVESDIRDMQWDNVKSSTVAMTMTAQNKSDILEIRSLMSKLEARLAKIEAASVQPVNKMSSPTTSLGQELLQCNSFGECAFNGSKVIFQKPTTVHIEEITKGSMREWSLPKVHIHTGDIVVWKWSTNENIQHATPNFEAHPQPEFSSGAIVVGGRFSFQFGHAGTYHVMSQNSAGLTGIVVVSELALTLLPDRGGLAISGELQATTLKLVGDVMFEGRPLQLPILADSYNCDQTTVGSVAYRVLPSHTTPHKVTGGVFVCTETTTLSYQWWMLQLREPTPRDCMGPEGNNGVSMLYHEQYCYTSLEHLNAGNMGGLAHGQTDGFGCPRQYIELDSGWELVPSDVDGLAEHLKTSFASFTLVFEDGIMRSSTDPSTSYSQQLQSSGTGFRAKTCSDGTCTCSNLYARASAQYQQCTTLYCGKKTTVLVRRHVMLQVANTSRFIF